MVALNIPLLQFHLFKNLTNQLQDKCMNLNIRPSVSPGKPDESYFKFISSIYRIDFDEANKFGIHHTLYIFFRNKKADDNSFTKPSSVELVEYDTRTFNSLIKLHYYVSNNGYWILNQQDEYFADYDTMKQGIVTISDAVVKDIIDTLQKGNYIL